MSKKSEWKIPPQLEPIRNFRVSIDDEPIFGTKSANRPACMRRLKCPDRKTTIGVPRGKTCCPLEPQRWDSKKISKETLAEDKPMKFQNPNIKPSAVDDVCFTSSERSESNKKLPQYEPIRNFRASLDNEPLLDNKSSNQQTCARKLNWPDQKTAVFCRPLEPQRWDPKKILEEALGEDKPKKLHKANHKIQRLTVSRPPRMSVMVKKPVRQHENVNKTVHNLKKVTTVREVETTTSPTVLVSLEDAEKFIRKQTSALQKPSFLKKPSTVTSSHLHAASKTKHFKLPSTSKQKLPKQSHIPHPVNKNLQLVLNSTNRASSGSMDSDKEFLAYEKICTDKVESNLFQKMHDEFVAFHNEFVQFKNEILAKIAQCNEAKTVDAETQTESYNTGGPDSPDKENDCIDRGSNIRRVKSMHNIASNFSPNVKLNNTVSKLNTPELKKLNKSMCLYNDLRNKLPILCTPKATNLHESLMTPSVRGNVEKMISRKVQQQLLMLNES